MKPSASAGGSPRSSNGIRRTDDLAEVGKTDRARMWFDRAVETSGPAGLLAEEADAVTLDALGNDPQALFHLALILAAYAIGKAEQGKPKPGVAGPRSVASRRG